MGTGSDKELFFWARVKGYWDNEFGEITIVRYVQTNIGEWYEVFNWEEQIIPEDVEIIKEIEKYAEPSVLVATKPTNSKSNEREDEEKDR